MNRTAMFLLPLTLIMTRNAISATGCNAEGAARSGEQLVSISELYTSEGCNSCPPADKWFSRLKPVASAEQPHIPLAFHVDYWDYIGWTDKFAQAKFSERQRRLVRAAGKQTVYTPQVFLNGADIGFWSSANALPRTLEPSRRRVPITDLALQWRQQADSALHLNLNVVPRDKDASRLKNAMPEWVVYLAVVEQNLSSKVNAGENANVLLQHAHTVRQFIGPLPLTANATGGEIRESLKLNPRWKPADLSVVAFVQHRATGEHLQALSVRLCEAG